VIRARFTVRDGEVVAFTLRGHAGRAPRGQDIVCAAVSALAQATVMGLEGVVGVAPEVEQSEGWLSCRLPEGLPDPQRREVQVLLRTLLLALRSIEAGYRDAVAVDEVREAPAEPEEGPTGAAGRR